MNDDELQHLRAVVNRAEQTLMDAVVDSCPGPHKPVQHRDHLPEWCHACGRTRRGMRMHQVDVGTATPV